MFCVLLSFHKVFLPFNDSDTNYFFSMEVLTDIKYQLGLGVRLRFRLGFMMVKLRGERCAC